MACLRCHSRQRRKCGPCRRPHPRQGLGGTAPAQAWGRQGGDQDAQVSVLPVNEGGAPVNDDWDNPPDDVSDGAQFDLDPETERRVRALLDKRERDRLDPAYNRLNVVVWHTFAGHLSNRIIDLEAYFRPLGALLDSLKLLAREAGNAAELVNVLEKVEAYHLDAGRYVDELRKLSEAMDEELQWYTDESFPDLEDGEPEEDDGADDLEDRSAEDAASR